MRNQTCFCMMLVYLLMLMAECLLCNSKLQSHSTTIVNTVQDLFILDASRLIKLNIKMLLKEITDGHVLSVMMNYFHSIILMMNINL